MWIVVACHVDYACRMKRIIFMVLLIPALVLAEGEVTGYRIVHPDGTVEFTDDPSHGGEEIKLREVQTVKKPYDESRQRNTAPDESQKPEKKAISGYTRLRIITPQPEQTIWFTGGGVTVSVSVDPPLQPGHMVAIGMDGTKRVKSANTSVSMTEVYRGTHTVSAAVVDANGNVLISAAPVTFYLRQRGK